MILHWKCKHRNIGPIYPRKKHLKCRAGWGKHGKCIIAELETLTETGNAIRNILTRNGFSLTHSISPPIHGASNGFCLPQSRKFIRAQCCQEGRLNSMTKLCRPLFEKFLFWVDLGNKFINVLWLHNFMFSS